MIFKILRKSAAILSIGAAVLFLSITGPSLHNSYLRSSVGDSVVKVLIPGRGGGTGFSVEAASGEKYIVTNAHVCAPSRDGLVKITNGDKLSTFKEIIYIDDEHDICLVEGDWRLPALSLSETPEKGDFMYIVGHPGLRALTVSQGEFIGKSSVKMLKDVEDRESCKGEVYELNIFEQLMYQREFACIVKYKTYSTSAVAYGGNSGSPVVDYRGRVMGILFAGNREQERDNHVVPLPELKRVLKNF
jgi:S1-C subfamily serine protease